MAVKRHKGVIKTAKTIVGKAKARRSASVMKSEYLAEIERFRLMDALGRLMHDFNCSDVSDMKLDI